WRSPRGARPSRRRRDACEDSRGFGRGTGQSEEVRAQYAACYSANDRICVIRNLQSSIVNLQFQEPPMSAGDYGDAFPNSRKVYVEGRAGEVAVAVPMREIALSGGEPPLRVYD